MEFRNYTRWTQREGTSFDADILGAPYQLTADQLSGDVEFVFAATTMMMTPDEARMLGVRLIEAAALADGPRAIRRQSTSTS